MACYRMEDGTVLDTAKAKTWWDESTHWNGNNHETLYESRKGRFYVEHTSKWQGSTPRAEWISEQEAVRWLLMNGHEVPERLVHLVEEVCE